MIESALVLTSASSTVFGALNVIQCRRLRAARHDPLTGLAARRLWTSRAQRAIRRPRGLVFLIVDGDDFKRVNDVHGHDAGDALLVAFARRLQTWTGGRGLAGRLGGDEFAVFLRWAATDPPLADALDDLAADLSTQVRFGGRTLRAGASIGAVIVADLPTPTYSQAMRAADQVLYQAKSMNRGGWNLVGKAATTALADRGVGRSHSPDADLSQCHGPAP
jgi:diguanylate cyclase (GGDEF)-like protein